MNVDARLLLLKKPTQEHDNFWIYEEDPNIAKKCSNAIDQGKGGKWMMFFDNSAIDDKWEVAVNFYRQGRLPGIHTLKVTTMRSDNFRLVKDIRFTKCEIFGILCHSDFT